MWHLSHSRTNAALLPCEPHPWSLRCSCYFLVMCPWFCWLSRNNYHSVPHKNLPPFGYLQESKCLFMYVLKLMCQSFIKLRKYNQITAVGSRLFLTSWTIVFQFVTFFFQPRLIAHDEKEERMRINILEMDRIIINARASVWIFILVIVRLDHSVH